MSQVVNTYPLSNYSFGTKEPKLEKDTSVADRLARMKIKSIRPSASSTRLLINRASSSRRCGNHASDFDADKENKREHGETSPAASLELELSVQSLQSTRQLVGDRDLGDATFLSTEPFDRLFTSIELALIARRS
ncbi:hypothetical protein F2Q70_00039683 [Brassica cretica]|uniref:Uncharacterized protein n=1 Tax=Brassica cretica TaxID=69181 RepID=A0A8S9K5C5_BRACR|nr:hypothetical protein F2Q70_00039683 [Brassica cretica]